MKTALLVAALGLAPVLAAADEPSWFPPQRCRAAWVDAQDRETRRARPYLYDFARDHSYGEYLARMDATLRVRDEPVRRADCHKEWTVLIAMDAESDLMPYSLWDLYEMEAGYASRVAGSTLLKDVIVQHDGVGDGGLRRIHVFQTEMPYELKSRAEFDARTIDDVKSPVIETLPEGAGTKLEQFTAFVDWGMRAYPAKHYLVILWGHGKGWIASDGEAKVHLTGPEIRDALARIHETTLEGARPIDNFVADACFMQGLELGAELWPHVRYVSGSAQVQTFLGLPYRTLFYNLERDFPHLRRFLRRQEWNLANGRIRERSIRSKHDDSPGLLAEAIPYLMKASLDRAMGLQGLAEARMDTENPDFTPAAEFFTYASVDARLMRERLAPSLEALGGAVTDYLAADPSEGRLLDVKNVVNRGNTVFRSGVAARELGTHLAGLGALAARTGDEAGDEAGDPASSEALLRGVGTARAALEQAVFSFFHAPRYSEFPGFSALGAWIPRNAREFSQGEPHLRGTLLFSGATPGPWEAMIRRVAEVP